jgi:hypothetical protein
MGVQAIEHFGLSQYLGGKYFNLLPALPLNNCLLFYSINVLFVLILHVLYK